MMTMLTSPTARILDLFPLSNEEQTVNVICLPGEVTRTRDYLQNGIFFMDDLTVNDTSTIFLQLGLLGPAI